MRITTLTLETTVESATGAVELVFTPRRALAFRAGQGGLLAVPGGGVKPYTFASDHRSGVVSIATTLHSGSRFKQALARLRPGDQVRAAGATGTLPFIAPTRSQVLLAQGIGITPFLSMARSHHHLDATLLQVGSAHYFEETAAAMTAAEHHEHRDGLVEAVRRTIDDRPGAQWSLSGRPRFVAALSAQLRAAGVPRRSIHKDVFWTLPAPATSPHHGDLLPA